MLAAKRRIVNRIIHVGKHEVLPDQDAKLVAKLIEAI